MKRTPPTRQGGIAAAKALKERLLDKGYPIRALHVFGSVARGQTHAWSDIDIAVLCEPFLPSKHDENVQFLLESKEVDVRIQTVCLHPEDLANNYWNLIQEVKEHGIVI